MKKHYQRYVDICLAIFLLLALLVASFVFTDTPDNHDGKVKNVFDQIESSFLSLENKN